MKRMPFHKYTPYPSVGLTGRRWPDRAITAAPLWCSVDLRDGNQALAVPMDIDKKIRMFELLTAMGFKEIEAGFPSASETEFAFVRKLIDEGRIPEDVTIQVLTQAREHLIRRSLEAVSGARNVCLHLYNPTSRRQRDVVFRMDKARVKDIAVSGTRMVMDIARQMGMDGIKYEYSPESFTGTELEYALEVCEAVIAEWEPSPGNKIIINLPSTVEMSTPNIFADRIEWFCGALSRRDDVIVSVHTHNDRGCAGAAAELAVMAGADRVEGALFGNGERSGNMDILIMAMNLYSQGVDPVLDLSDIDNIVKVYSECTGMPVHPRNPYAGELVYTAFSGSHQDAINKGMKAQDRDAGAKWDVPYLPIDPRDVGRNYEAVIRINSQSGKGGAAYILEQSAGIQVPKWMQPDLGAEVQRIADASGKELGPRDIRDCFTAAFVEADSPYRFVACHIDSDTGGQTHVRAVVAVNGGETVFTASGSGPIDAFVNGVSAALGVSFAVENYAEHAVEHGAGAKAAAFIRITGDGGKFSCGCGMDQSISVASLKAVVSAMNRLKG